MKKKEEKEEEEEKAIFGFTNVKKEEWRKNLHERGKLLLYLSMAKTKESG